MKDLILKSMHIERFKGLDHFDINFTDRTSISGRNALGKTCIYDAYLWVLFNKDSRGRLIDKVQYMVGGIADKDARTVVSVTFEIDGQAVEFRRELYQCWHKKRGTTEMVYDGDTSEYFCNNVPLTLAAYNEKIAAVFDRERFELVSNINMFASLDVKARRAILSDISNTESLIRTIAADFPAVTEAFGARKSAEEYQEELRRAMSRIAAEINQIPVRIDEIKRGMPAKLPDTEALNKEKSSIKSDVDKIDDYIASLRELAVTGSNVEQKKRLAEVESEIFSIENAAKSAYQRVVAEESEQKSELQAEFDRASRRQSRMADDIGRQERLIAQTKEKFEGKKKEWMAENSRMYQPGTMMTSCPTCGHVFTPEELAEKEGAQIEMFNRTKLARLAEIEKDGKEIKEVMTGQNAELERLKGEHTEMTKYVDECRARVDEAGNKPSAAIKPDDKLKGDNKYRALCLEAVTLRQQIDSATVKNYDADIAEERKKRDTLYIRMKDIDAELATKQQYEQAEKRMAELESQSRDLGAEKAAIEQKLDEIQAFQSRKMNEIECRINGMFKFVRIQMFKPNKTNDGVADACEITVDDVPYSVLNTAARINAGIDICCTLAVAYGIKAPVWVDNSESVNDVMDGGCQLITLRVSDENILTITNN